MAGLWLEIRSYNLRPGTRDSFHQLFLNQSLPLLLQWKIDVVAFGPSEHDEDSYFLMRAYRSLGDRQQSQDAFYGSDDWRKGPREAMLAMIVNYTSIVVELEEATVAGLRR